MSDRRARWLTFAAAFLGWMLDGVEIGLFPVIARPALQEMLGVQGDAQVGIWMGRLTAFFLFGAAAGGALFGWLGDRVGRVRAMALSILAYSLFTGACYFARVPWELAVLRFAAALGMGGQWALGVALVMETWPERHRPWLAGAIGAASNVGILLIGLVAYIWPVTRQSWRWIMLVGAAPAALTFLIRMFVPESQRWRDAAERDPGRGSPLREVFGPDHRVRTLLGILLSSVVLIGTWGSVQWLPLLADQLTGGTDFSAKALTSMLLAGGAIVGCFAGSALGHWSRRGAFALLCLASYGGCFWLFKGCHAYGLQFLALTGAIGALTASFYGWLPLYLPELFPTRIRATGQGIGYNFGRILAGFGALGAGQLVSHYHGSYSDMGLSITLIYLLGALLVWLAPETRGCVLPP